MNESKQVVNLVGETLKLAVAVGEKFDKPAVEGLLRVLKAGASVFPLAGLILSVFDAFLPDRKHEAIMNEFKKLHESVRQIRDDISKLKDEMVWQCTQVSYQECVRRIQTAMEYAYEIRSSGDDAKRRNRFQERLKDLNKNGNLTIAIDMLLDGTTGEADFASNQILENYYNRTDGHRPDVAKLAASLVQLAVGGLVALMTTEALKYGSSAPKDLAPKYGKRTCKVSAVVKTVLDRCENEADKNMQRDLERIVADNSQRPNNEIVGILHGELQRNYDWLRIHCLVYNDISGFENHCFSGSSVDKLHHHGKCAIAFYIDASIPFYVTRSIVDTKGIIQRAYDVWSADDAYNQIREELARRNIRWWGLACINQNANLEYKGNAEGRFLLEPMYYFHACVLLF